MSADLISKLSDEEVAAAEAYAAYAFDIWHSVMQDHSKWTEISDQEKSAWMHMIIGLRDVSSIPTNHVKLNAESHLSLEAILSPFRGTLMTQQTMREAHELIHAWVKERVQNELKDDEVFSDLVDVELVVIQNTLTPRFVGQNERGHELLKRLFA